MHKTEREVTAMTPNERAAEIARLKSIVDAAYADGATQEDKEAKYEIWDRYIMLKRIEKRPAHLVPGFYKLKESVFNTIGDARSNKSHWRRPLEKKIDLPVGYTFSVAIDGVVCDGKDASTRVFPWNFNGHDDEDPKEAAQKAKGRQFLRDLMAAAEPATPAPVRQIEDAMGWCPRLETILDQLVKEGVDVVDLARRATATDD